MRCLNRVVFVNSANTPYAEIGLDGNVHFIGTQGVGKSTLLRAILFFYNGDKLKLGIPKEKKGFDEFYLPHSNSYIVYEVTHEYGPFCVLVFRYQGRASFRFIDAAWNRSWLVDGKTGDVTSEYTVIRQRLDGTYMSRIIDKYDEYRNILYGNHNATGKEFYKFAIMESPKYQNIPRSLQNVFLNSRVDADFIKEIIIRSMNDDEVGIDLGYYRRQVAEFAQEYDDISAWFKTNAKGEITVRRQADQVITQYRQMLYHREHIIVLYAEMLYALRTAREVIPYLKEQREQRMAEIQRLERLVSEEKRKFEQENTGLNKQIGAVEEKLKTVKEKRKRYQEMDINTILKRVETEYDVRNTLETLMATKDTLMRQYENLSAKYKTLEDVMRSEYQTFEMSSKERIAAAKDEYFKARDRLSEIREVKRTEVETEYRDATCIVDEKMSELILKERDLSNEITRLNYFRPLGDEIDAAEKNLVNLHQDEKVSFGERKNLELQIKALRAEYETKRSDREKRKDDALRELEMDSAAIREKAEEVDKLLAKSEGSLYQWLDENRPGWENTFGKLVDESRILYSTELKPVVAGGAGDTVFGVSLDLSEIECTLRTPASLKEDRTMYKEALDEISSRRMEQEEACVNDISELEKEMSPRLKVLQGQKSICEAKAEALPGKIRAEEIRIKGLEDKQKEMIAVRRDELDRQRQELAAQRVGIEHEQNVLAEVHLKKMKSVEKSYSDERKSIEDWRNKKISTVLSEVQERKTVFERKLAHLKTRRDAEMAGAGVDVAALNECETSIEEKKAELKFIENNRATCIEYRIDCRDLFDREEEFRDNKRALESKREQLELRFEVRGKKLTGQKNDAEQKLDQLRADLEECEEGVKQCEEFQGNTSIFPDYLSAVQEKITMSSAVCLVSELREAIYERSEIQSRFKQAVNLFKNSFGPGNTFNFKTNVTTDEDYLDYAAGLEEFVDQNKIEDYRGRTSDRYLEILSRVSREMGEITRHGSEVEKTIRDINYDFKEKNFVGAIRSIEIRRTESGDKMVQLLLRVKEFTDENQFHLGGLNLFSDTGEHADINRQAVKFLQDFMECLKEYAVRHFLTLSDTFQLQFRVMENDNDTGWVEKIANVGSDGTDILVKAMVNIMLINVFKEKVSRKFGEFRIHCMMDEIGKLHPSNVKGILDFANSRNIILINSSPTTYNVSDYKYTYLLSKDSASKTIVTPLITRREAELGR